VIVYSMCRLVSEAARRGGTDIFFHTHDFGSRHRFHLPLDRQVIADARRIVGDPEDSTYIPLDPREFCSKIFHTCYMGTENSSAETRKRAKDLSEAIGR
jgi:NAD+ synthase (glutamine-hydrolysing)